ncbi:hypothetical protein [Maioricimonas sp. JC845]|uniref:hypothetical protein n=1 Tax=Maioricimonas sp. JC845 TaxID=3232138 RepID=UPI00345825B5
MLLARALLSDERGFVISAELVLVSTILVVGLITGLTCVQSAIVAELKEVGGAFTRLDQSYSFTGMRGCWTPRCGLTSWTAGSANGIDLGPRIIESAPSYRVVPSTPVPAVPECPGGCPPVEVDEPVRPLPAPIQPIPEPPSPCCPPVETPCCPPTSIRVPGVLPPVPCPVTAGPVFSPGCGPFAPALEPLVW